MKQDTEPFTCVADWCCSRCQPVADDVIPFLTDLAAGGSNDWAYDARGIQYAYSIELRDTGEYGFLLPAEQILPTGEETWAGIVAAINAMN